MADMSFPRKDPNSTLLGELCTWFATQTNGEWEHVNGISIQTCDNPGWWVKVSLVGTPLEHREYSPVRLGLGKDDHPTKQTWLHCYIEDRTWNGAGDPTQLPEILGTFLEWTRLDP